MTFTNCFSMDGDNWKSHLLFTRTIHFVQTDTIRCPPGMKTSVILGFRFKNQWPVCADGITSMTLCDYVHHRESEQRMEIRPF